jgi:hypothetical protein
MTRIGFIFILLGSFISTNSWGNYTLPDLEVLAQEENFVEFFAHALDVRPIERKESWKGMVTKMADGYARKILAQNEVKKVDFTKIESLYSWPSLKTDDVFKLHRQDIGLRFLKTCLKNAKPCWNTVNSFWELDKNDPEVAFKLAEMTIKFPDKSASTWSYLEVALRSPLSEFYCKKDFVLQSLWTKLEIDYIRLGVKGDFLKKIDDTVHPDCLISLNQWSSNKLNKPDKSFDRELAYQILNAQGKTTPALTDFFYTVYLLESPSQGELFNYAWNRLTELSKSMSRRDEVMNRIRTLDPLPDEVFSSMDETKKRAILGHFKNKFPEYLYFYTDQCLLFYGGSNTFPNGNPTMKCQNLMGGDNASTLLGADRVERYLKVRSI